MTTSTCGHGWPPCGSADRIRRYQQGDRCDAHAPWRLAGLPDPSSARYCAPGFGRCYCGRCPNYVPQAGIGTVATPATPTVVDLAAARSGKRATGAQRRRARS
jgi:hypothetical protein